MKFYIKLFIILTLIFSSALFYADFFFSKKQETEEFNEVVEPIKKVSPITKKRLEEIKAEIKNKNLNNNNETEIKEEEKQKIIVEDKKEEVPLELAVADKEEEKQNFLINYVLDKYEQELEPSKKDYIKNILSSDLLNSKIDSIITDLMQVKEEVRGKMKNGTVYLFAPHLIETKEMISVFIHEIGHFVDLYYLKKGYFGDASNNFYDISWESTKILKAGNSKKDFISGYAMTNKYEDFAESFEFFILHNKDFLEKAQNSTKLMKKYEFFEEYIFTLGEFKNSNFGENKFKENIWDTTKLKISEKKFLNYIKND